VAAATSVGSCRLIALDHSLHTSRLRIRFNTDAPCLAISEIGVFKRPSEIPPTAQLELSNLPTVKFFAKEINDFDSLNKVQKDPENGILFTGSSSIKLWGTIREDMAPYPVIQRGFGGSRIEDLAYYLQRIVYPHQFKAIAIFCGTNNITGSGREMSEDSIMLWVNNIDRQIRFKYPATPIFWIAVTPVPSRVAVLDKVLLHNRRMESYCATRPNTFFINTVPSYLDKEGKTIPGYFLGDMLHQNHQGYLVWAEIIKHELAAHLK
jgi:lysophospholipase L1-like esterase